MRPNGGDMYPESHTTRRANLQTEPCQQPRLWRVWPATVGRNSLPGGRPQWIIAKGQPNGTVAVVGLPVFDSQLTNYDVLNELTERGRTWFTPSQRGARGRLHRAQGHSTLDARCTRPAHRSVVSGFRLRFPASQ